MKSSLKKVGYNEYGYPNCPNDPSLSMKYCGITREKRGGLIVSNGFVLKCVTTRAGYANAKTHAALQ